jgi:hypothetical protein
MIKFALWRCCRRKTNSVDRESGHHIIIYARAEVRIQDFPFIQLNGWIIATILFDEQTIKSFELLPNPFLESNHFYIQLIELCEIGFCRVFTWRDSILQCEIEHRLRDSSNLDLLKGEFCGMKCFSDSLESIWFYFFVVGAEIKE